MTHKQVERYKCIDAEPDCVKRFTRTSLRQANGAIIKEKISMTRKNPKEKISATKNSNPKINIIETIIRDSEFQNQ